MRSPIRDVPLQASFGRSHEGVSENLGVFLGGTCSGMLVYVRPPFFGNLPLLGGSWAAITRNVQGRFLMISLFGG